MALAANLLLKCGIGGARLVFLSPCPPKSVAPLFHHSFKNNNNTCLVTRRRRRCAVVSLCSSSRSTATSTVEADAVADEEQNKQKNDEEKLIKDAGDLLDIRVGLILRAWRHEEADSLYVEEVDIGEPQPRTICSGLVNYIPIDQLQERKVVVLANLKPRNMRGVKSCGMLMAASDASHQSVELLVPPQDSLPGQRIWFGSENDAQNQPPHATPNQIQKKKLWELVQPHLKTDDSGIAMLGVHCMRTSAGVITCASLKNANIS